MPDCDTPDKRRSAANTILLVFYPVADGTIDAQDREQVSWIYSGITVGSPPIITRRAGQILLLKVG